MSLTTEEQELFDLARASLPAWYADDERANEFLSACAVIFASARAQGQQWLREMTLITLATVDLNVEPDFLDQHARDRGTSRQLDETDAALISRLRTVEDVVTRPAILAALQAMLTAGSFSGSAAMIEFPRDLAYFGEYTGFGGDGVCVIERTTGNVCLFTPPTGQEDYPRPPFKRAYGADLTFKLTIATGGGPNDGTFVVTGLVDNKIQYDNASGVDETTAPDAVWGVERYDADDNLTDGFARAYFDRGYRMGSCPPSAILVILPFGTTVEFEASVREMLRQKAGAGIRAIIERRTVA